MKRVLSFFMAMILALSLAPRFPAAAGSYKPESFTIIGKKSSTIAPGVTQDIVTSRLSNKEQMIYYLATVDLNHKDANGNQDVHIYSSYKDAECGEGKWGMSMLTDQIKAAQEKHSDPNGGSYIPYYNVVAGINASFYNMSTGQPEGAFAMEGQIITKATGSFFAIRKDGSAVIGYSASEWDTYNTADNPIVEAVGGNRVQIRDGVLASTVTGDLNARTSIGITADGKVVMAVSDGKQAPYSSGTDMKHMGEMLLEAGCYKAIELDGGGSTTYAARPEGGDSVQLVNKPCDGSERSISSGLIIVSTTPPAYGFDHAALTAEHDYVTPNSAVQVEAIGVSPVGASADIPENAVWGLADISLGTVSSNGLFTSNGTAGDAVVQMTVDGKVVGETTIHVVEPERLEFSLPAVALPYGKESAPINVSAKRGEHDVYYAPEQVTLTLSDPALGTLGAQSGSTFTACESSDTAPEEGTITATYSGGLSAEIDVTLGKGSEIVINFDDASVLDDLNWACEGGNNYNNLITAEWVNASSGRVHDGNGAVAVTVDFSQTADFGGSQGVYFSWTGQKVELKKAICVGAWVWVPDETDVMKVFFAARKVTPGANNTVNGSNYQPGDSLNYDGGHWQYVYVDMDKDTPTNIEGGFLFFELFGNAAQWSTKSVHNKVTFYVDSVMVDYSTVAPDREFPKFGDVSLRGSGDAVTTMTRGTITPSNSGIVAVSAPVTDNIGVNPDSAVAYVDGVRVDGASYQNGTLSMSEVNLAAGVHTVTLGISDEAGNYSSATRQLNVSANASVPTVKVVARNPSADSFGRLPIGSLLWVDVVATDVAAIDGVDMDLDLNNISVWELEHADVDYYFNLTYAMDKVENIASLHFTRKTGGEIDTRTGEVVLASLPIRTWELHEPITYGGVTDKANDLAQGKPMSSNGGKEPKTHTAATAWSGSKIWPTDVKVDVDRGSITYKRSYAPDVLPVFSGARIQVDTELFSTAATVKTAYPGQTRWHSHTLVDAEGSATCTEPGYSGRKVCSVCNSIVEWGEKVDALKHVASNGNSAWGTFCFGHSHPAIPSGAMHCGLCGQLLTGDYINPTYGFTQTFVEGFLANGWFDESYYVSGKKVLGLQQVVSPDAEEGSTDTLWYNFGEDGVCEGKQPFTGDYTEPTTEVTTTYVKGVIAEGWVGESYYVEGVRQTGFQNLPAPDAEPDSAETLLYNFGEDGICAGQEPYTGDYTDPETKATTAYVNGKVAVGWVDESYYVEGVRQTGFLQLPAPDAEPGSTEVFWYDFGEDGVCTGQQPYTGKLTQDGKSYYAIAGVVETGWFNIGEDRYHAGEDGVLHQVTVVDTRTCIKSGYLQYTCETCKKAGLAQDVWFTQSEEMWFESHDWDDTWTCKKCGVKGIDIGTGTLTPNGQLFSFKGGATLAEITVTVPNYPSYDAPRNLIVGGDKKKGLEGYSEYSNADDVGVATVTVYGRTNFYGQISATYTIVPADVGTLSVTPAAGDGALTISWDAAPGADYYDLYYKKSGEVWITPTNDSQLAAGHIEGTSCTIENLGAGVYTFRAASRAVRDGVLYKCIKWSPEIEVTVSLPTAITVAAVKNGTASTDPAGEALPGQTVTVTAIPDEGYDVTGVTVRDADKKTVAVTQTGENQYTFTMPTSAVTVTPSFNAQGECEYFDETGPFRGQLRLTGLLPGRTYVCQMEKADASGKSLGCAAITVFTATGTTQVLDVLNCPTGYLVSLFAYPASGNITGIGDLNIAFYGRYIPSSAVVTVSAAAMQNEYISDEGIDSVGGDDETETDNAEPSPDITEPDGDVTSPDTDVTEPDVDVTEPGSGDGTTGAEGSGSDDKEPAPGPHGDCAYLTNRGPFTAQLQLTGLIPGRTYVCQMQKANASGKDIGCAAIVVFTAESETQLLDVLPSTNGYLVLLFTYPTSGTIDSISDLSLAFYKHTR